MGDYGDSYDICRTDEQKAAYVRGWDDCKNGSPQDHGDLGEIYFQYYDLGYEEAAG